MRDWLKRIWPKLRCGGLEYLLTAGTSYLPEVVLRYRHSVLFERDTKDVKINTRGCSHVRVFDRSNADELLSLLQNTGVDQTVALDRKRAKEWLASGETCFAVVRNGQLLSYKWTTTSPKPLLVEKMYCLFDPGSEGYFVHTGVTVPSARRRGLSWLCSQKAIAYHREQGRHTMYASTDFTNLPTMTMHRKLGSRVVGETFYVCLLGLRWVYRRSWPTQVERFERIQRRGCAEK